MQLKNIHGKFLLVIAAGFAVGAVLNVIGGDLLPAFLAALLSISVLIERHQDNKIQQLTAENARLNQRLAVANAPLN